MNYGGVPLGQLFDFSLILRRFCADSAQNLGGAQEAPRTFCADFAHNISRQNMADAPKERLAARERAAMAAADAVAAPGGRGRGRDGSHGGDHRCFFLPPFSSFFFGWKPKSTRLDSRSPK